MPRRRRKQFRTLEETISAIEKLCRGKGAIRNLCFILENCPFKSIEVRETAKKLGKDWILQLFNKKTVQTTLAQIDSRKETPSQRRGRIRLQWSEGEIKSSYKLGRPLELELIVGEEDITSLNVCRIIGENEFKMKSSYQINKNYSDTAPAIKEKVKRYCEKNGHKYFGTYLDKELYSKTKPSIRSSISNQQIGDYRDINKKFRFYFQGTLLARKPCYKTRMERMSQISGLTIEELKTKSSKEKKKLFNDYDWEQINVSTGKITQGSIKWLKPEERTFYVVGTDVVFKILTDISEEFYNEPFLKLGFIDMLKTGQISSMNVWKYRGKWHAQATLEIDEKMIDEPKDENIFLYTQVTSDKFGYCPIEVYNEGGRLIEKTHYSFKDFMDSIKHVGGNRYKEKRDGAVKRYGKRIYRVLRTRYWNKNWIIIVGKPRLDSGIQAIDQRLPWRPFLGSKFILRGGRTFTTFKDPATFIEDFLNYESSLNQDDAYPSGEQ